MRRPLRRLGAALVGLGLSVGLMAATAAPASAHTTAWTRSPYYNTWCYSYHLSSGAWFWTEHQAYVVCDTHDYGGGSGISHADIAIWKAQVVCKSGAVYTTGYLFNDAHPNQQVTATLPGTCNSDGISRIRVIDYPFNYYWFGDGPTYPMAWWYH